MDRTGALARYAKDQKIPVEVEVLTKMILEDTKKRYEAGERVDFEAFGGISPIFKINSMDKNEQTDLEAFVALYKRFGIECKVGHNECDPPICIVLGTDDSDGITTTDEKLVGYLGFYSQIEFDKNGKFVEQSFYE